MSEGGRGDAKPVRQPGQRTDTSSAVPTATHLRSVAGQCKLIALNPTLTVFFGRILTPDGLAANVEKTLPSKSMSCQSACLRRYESGRVSSASVRQRKSAVGLSTCVTWKLSSSSGSPDEATDAFGWISRLAKCAMTGGTRPADLCALDERQLEHV